MEGIKSEARLTFWEASSIIIGHGVGAGVLAVPYLASRNSWYDIVWIMVLAYTINLLLHYIIAELSLNNHGAQFIKCFENELFTGKLKKPLTWMAFALLGFSVIINVSGFITGASAVLTSWFQVPKAAGMVIFYVIAGAVVFFGMKLVGICEKLAVFLMAGVVTVLMAAVFMGDVYKLQADFVAVNNMLALYSMIMFSLSAVMSVPQVVKGLDGDVKKIKGSIALGTGLNLLLIVFITLVTLLGAGPHISENGALVDLSEQLGGWVSIVGYVFSLLALSTSFWANTLNLRDVVNEQTGWGTKVSWAAASVPCLLIALLGITSFVGFARLASVVQVLTGIGVVVSYHRSRKKNKISRICGITGTLPFQILVIAASLVSTVGALIKVS